MVQSLIFLVTSCVIFGVLLWHVVSGSDKKTSSSVLLFLAGSLCALFARVDSIASLHISASGFEANAQQVVKNAEDVTRDVKKVAVAAAKAIVSLNGNYVASTGYIVPPPAAARDGTKAHLLELLRAMEVPEDQVQSVDKADRQGVILTYRTSLIGLLAQMAFSRKDQALYQTIASLAEKNGLDEPPQVDEFLAKHSLHDNNIEELNGDFAFYLKNGTQRRPDVWAKRDTWLPHEDVITAN